MNSNKGLPGARRASAPAPLAFVVSLATALLPALLAGIQLALLLAFLNPDLPFSARGTSIAAALLALALFPLAFLVQVLGMRLRNVTAPRLVPWSLTLVLAAASLGDWVNASHYSFFQPPGLNGQLIKAALWLSLGAVLAFYTALLHTVHHRAYGRRSRLLLAVVAGATIFAVADRRASFRPPPPPARSPIETSSNAAPRLLVVGLDGASLDVLLPLARQGRLPFFATLVEQGSYARLGTFAPLRPLALWTSVATGELPYRHGLLGAAHAAPRWLSPAGGELKLLPLGAQTLLGGSVLGPPLPPASQRSSALLAWEILDRLRGPSRAIGFAPPLSAPIAAAEALEGEPPEASADPYEQLVRAARRADQPRLAAAAAALASASPPRSLFVFLPGLRELALATTGGFEAAELEGSRARDQRKAAGALTSYYAELDAGLDALWERLPPPRVLAVVSAYGVTAPQGGARVLRALLRFGRSAGTLAGAPDGALLLHGEGVRRGVALPGGRVVDLLPSLLYLSGLPIARDFDGRVLTEACEPSLLKRESLTFVPSYLELAGGGR